MDNRGDILQLCRLCLVKDDVNIPIFEEQGDIRQIFLKISSCLPVKVDREDKLPKKICDGCSYKLDMFYDFWNSTANAEKQLMTWLGEAGMTSKMTDGTIAAVTQQAKPNETVVKQEELDPSDIHTEENDDKSYMFHQKFSEDEPGPSATTINDEPPPKRARRTAAVKAQIAMDPESDDDEDSGEPLTKVEDESEESEGEDHDPNFVDVPSTSADDQPGPSGVGKDGDAPSPNSFWDDSENIKKLKRKHSIKECRILLKDVKLDKSLNFVNNVVKLPETTRRKYTCYICWKKFSNYHELNKHKIEHLDEDEDKSSEVNSSKKPDKSPKSITKKITKSRLSDESPQGKVDLTSSPIHKCETCQVDFDSIDSVKKHHMNKCKFLCGACGRNYNTIHAFTVHILQHKISVIKTLAAKPHHKCPMCSDTFEEYFQLKTHNILIHKGSQISSASEKSKKSTNKSELTCELCFDVFESPSELKDHMEFHNQLTKSGNDETVTNKVEETKIESVEHDIEPLAVNEGNIKENDEQSGDDIDGKKDGANDAECPGNGDADIQETKPLIMENVADDDDDTDIEEGYESLKSDSAIPVNHYKCKRCDRIYMNLDEYEKHIQNEKCIIIKECKVCKYNCYKNSVLYSHIIDNHQHLSICKFCFESFYSKKKLDEHKLLYHFKTFKNLCKICFQCFASFQEFNTHLQKEHLNL